MTDTQLLPDSRGSPLLSEPAIASGSLEAALSQANTVVFVKCHAQAGPCSLGTRCYGCLEQGESPRPMGAVSAMTVGIIGTERARKGP